MHRYLASIYVYIYIYRLLDLLMSVEWDHQAQGVGEVACIFSNTKCFVRWFKSEEARI